MNNAMDFDLLVVGGGVLGTFHAYHAAERGLRVALLERSSTPRGATVQNFGQIVPSGMNKKWQDHGRKSLEVYKGIQSRFDIAIRQHGSIYIASDEEEMTLIHELHTLNQTNDYPSVLLTKAQCLEKYPSLQRSYCKGGLYFPEEISANPRQMIHRVQQFMRIEGRVQLHNYASIRELYVGSEGKVVAVASDGRSWTGAKAIVCSGGEFKALFASQFAESDLELVKLQMLRLKPQQSTWLLGNILTGLSIRRYESFSECPSYAAIKAGEDPDAFWKTWSIHILFKQEADGSIILGDSHEYASAREVDALTFDAYDDVHQYFIAEGRKIMNLEHWDVDATWLGHYPQCKTQDIFQMTIDRNIHIVTGIGGKGMTASAGFSYFNLQNLLG